MPLEAPARIVSELTSRGYNADREAVTLLAGADDPARALETTVEAAPDDAVKITAEHVRTALGDGDEGSPPGDAGPEPRPDPDPPTDPAARPDDADTDDSSAEDDGSADEGARGRDDRAAEAATGDADDPAAVAGSGGDDPHEPPSDDPAGADRPSTSAPVADPDDSTGNADATDPATDGEPAASTTGTATESRDDGRGESPSVSTGTDAGNSDDVSGESPVEMGGSVGAESADVGSDGSVAADRPDDAATAGTGADGNDGSATPSTGSASRTGDRSPPAPDIDNDVTGESTGTGTYDDFVSVFRDRYERLSDQLRGRVNHRPAEAIESMGGGGDAAMIGMVNDVRSTASGHWLVELEDTSGTFPCLVMKDRDFADVVDELLRDEVIAVEGTLADDGGILFVDAVHFPDVPRTYQPATADREVSAALISDIHVGSQEFARDAWERFADWLHTDEAADVEYLLIAGDMVEGVGVYPDQDEELDILDIYEQYERFNELLKAVPGDMEIVMIPGNHDAVRLAEPQPGFDEELRSIMSAHDARISGNPSVVTVEGVSVLMYHGVSLDELIAEFPEDSANYDDPEKPMAHLLKKRHVAPQYGGHMRLAPEEKDYLVIDDVPDVFHTGHVHKLGTGQYHNVLTINSACWQRQTGFQESVNIDPDVGYAPIVDLSTLELTVRKFT